MSENPQMILASASSARRAMLEKIGLSFTAFPAAIDEKALKNQAIEAGKTPAEIALFLAGEKALDVSRKNPDAFVIGGDQILECDGEILSKAKDKNEAKEKLKFLSNKKHHLFCSVALAKNGKIIWSFTDEAVMTMPDLPEKFLDRYCEKAGESLLRSVGAYEIEKHGAWLFSSVRGDYFTILGLPLLPLLSYLREEEGIAL